MKTPLDELDEHFNALITETDRERFFRAVCEYLLYIRDTSPLNVIARESFPGGSGGVERLYKALQKAGEEVGNTTDKVWGDVVGQNVGRPSTYGAPASFWHTDTLRPFVRVFHLRMVKGVLARGLTRKRKIPILIQTGNATIYLSEDKTKHYSIKSRGKYKHKIPQRFQILLILQKIMQKQGGGISAEKLKDRLKVKDVSDVRKEIREINRHFRNKVSDKGDVIDSNKKTGRYIYLLNHKLFDFDFK